MSKVLILLSTFNGEKYLKEQLLSLMQQSYKNIMILARDDCSSDGTLDILKTYNIDLIDTKKNLGVKGSFQKLLSYGVLNSDAEYFMFCDQDDIWKSDKVEKTLSKIKKMKQQFGNIPLLVHTDLEVVDEQLNTINSSFMDFQKIDPTKNKFHNLLMQNTVTGCTVMINRELAQICLPIPDKSIMHDWWIALIASKFGNIGYVNDQTIKYRQHDKNTIGAKGFSYWEIIKKGFNIFYKINIDINIIQAKFFLKNLENQLNAESIKMLQEFTSLDKKSWWQKRVVLWKYRLLKQGFIRNVGLFLKI